MKKIFYLAIALITATPIFANNDDIVVKSKVSSATVFLQGAQVFREKYVTVKQGVTKIVFDDVSANINSKNIQASTNKGSLILDVKHNVFYIEPEAVKPQVIPARIQNEINRLEDSITLKRFEIDLIRNRKQNYLAEKKMILDNSLMRGEGKADSLPILMQASTFYRQKLEEIDTRLFEIKMKEHMLDFANRKMQSRLNELRNYNRKRRQPRAQRKAKHQVFVTISSPVAQTVRLKINYMVTNAGWSPSYDLRASANDQPLSLIYKAHVYQNTGENWDNVKLTLSTYNQNCVLSVPELAVWDLMDRNSEQFKLKQKKLTHTKANSGYMANTLLNTQIATFNTNMATKNANRIVIKNQSPDDDFKMAKRARSIQSGTFENVEFKIPLKNSIASSNEQTLLVIAQEKLNSRYNYSTIPKVNKDAFLLTEITDWQKINLLQATANIYYDNTFVGETFINPEMLKDTFELALGRDKRINTSRKKIKDVEKVSRIGKSRSRTITIELLVKNNKQDELEINLKDQIPVSKQESIVVSLLESNGAQLENETGLLKWNMKLKPKEMKVITFTYKIEYNKGQDVL